MNWLNPLKFEAKQIDVLSSRSDSTGTWILEREEFMDWAISSGKTLWCTGIRKLFPAEYLAITLKSLKAGAGKTVVA